LFQRLLKFNHFSENIALNIIRQIMLGLNYLHAQSITHRDIKPENILLVSDKEDVFDIKISDLGFACMYDKDTGLDLVLGTPIYMAPELI
jgi:serine/threonine protein kinase